MAKEAIVIVDPISTGGSVAFEAYTRGFAVIACWCNELTPEFKSHLPDCCLTDFSFYAEVEEGEKTIADFPRPVEPRLQLSMLAALGTFQIRVAKTSNSPC